MRITTVIALACLLAACSEPPECIHVCNKFGGTSSVIRSEAEFVVKCNDGAFFDEDNPKKCEPHGGLRNRTNLHSHSHPACFCRDGSMMDGEE